MTLFDESARFEIFLKQHQQNKDKALVRDLIGCALENGHVFQGWSDEDIVNDILDCADDDIEKHIGLVSDPITKIRLLFAVSSIKNEIY